MKKTMMCLIMGVLLASIMSLAITECNKGYTWSKEDQKCLYNSAYGNGGGSFMIQKGKTLFNVTSNYDGFGYGALYSRINVKQQNTLYFYRGYLRSVSVQPQETVVKKVFHIKMLSKPVSFNKNNIDTIVIKDDVFSSEDTKKVLSDYSFKPLQSYEIISSMKNTNYKIKFIIPNTIKQDRVAFGSVNGDVFEVYPLELTSNTTKFNYFSVTITSEDLGLLNVYEVKKNEKKN